MPVHPRVKGAAGGAGVAGAVSAIILWAMTTQDISVPAEIASAITTLIAASFAFVGGWIRTAPPT